ncbi:unnamed protein product [Knipowitschia caucasica]
MKLFLLLIFSLLSTALLRPAPPPLAEDRLQSRVNREKPATVKQGALSGCHLSTCVQHQLIHALFLLQQEQYKNTSSPDKIKKYGRRRRGVERPRPVQAKASGG